VHIDLRELAQFIVKAKKNTYAGEREGQRESDDSKNLQYKEGSYVYRDRYFGSERFGGVEVVWFKDKPVWLMNYYGGIEKKSIDSETVFSILRKALLRVSSNRPFRGPRLYEEEDFEYRDSSFGDITEFSGTEEILYRGETIHRVRYAGGIIKE
jgi:hypothetical protein